MITAPGGSRPRSKTMSVRVGGGGDLGQGGNAVLAQRASSPLVPPARTLRSSLDGIRERSGTGPAARVAWSFAVRERSAYCVAHAGPCGERRARRGRCAPRAAATGADALICLGDLLLFVDYADHAQGIFAELFGAEAAREFIALRTAQDVRRGAGAVRAAVGGGWAAIRPAHPQRRRPAQYAELFAAMPEPAYLTYGNVDIPRLVGRAPAPRAPGPGRRAGWSWAAGRSGSSAAGCARRTGRRTRSTTTCSRPR